MTTPPFYFLAPVVTARCRWRSYAPRSRLLIPPFASCTYELVDLAWPFRPIRNIFLHNQVIFLEEQVKLRYYFPGERIIFIFRNTLLCLLCLVPKYFCWLTLVSVESCSNVFNRIALQLLLLAFTQAAASPTRDAPAPVMPQQCVALLEIPLSFLWTAGGSTLQTSVVDEIISGMLVLRTTAEVDFLFSASRKRKICPSCTGFVTPSHWLCVGSFLPWSGRTSTS